MYLDEEEYVLVESSFGKSFQFFPYGLEVHHLSVRWYWSASPTSSETHQAFISTLKLLDNLFSPNTYRGSITDITSVKKLSK